MKQKCLVKARRIEAWTNFSRIALLMACIWCVEPDSYTLANDHRLIDSVAMEVKRAAKELGKEQPPLYYLGCGIVDYEIINITGSFGAVVSNSHKRVRILDVDVRCGDYSRDNTHPIPGYNRNFGRPSQIPLDNSPIPIRMALWRVISEEYRKSSERFAQVKALDLTISALRDKSDDFSKEKQRLYFEERQPLIVDRGLWINKVKKATKILRKFSGIYQGTASFNAIKVSHIHSGRWMDPKE